MVKAKRRKKSSHKSTHGGATNSGVDHKQHTAALLRKKMQSREIERLHKLGFKFALEDAAE